MTERAGIKPAASVPTAEPRIAPTSMKAIRYPRLFLSNVITQQSELTVNTFSDMVFVKRFLLHLYSYARNDFVKGQISEKSHKNTGNYKDEQNSSNDHGILLYISNDCYYI